MAKKKVGIQLGRQAQNQAVEERWALELEGLAPVADVVEIRADTPAEFAAGVADMDAIITSWGLRIDQQVVSALKKAVATGSPPSHQRGTGDPRPNAMSRGWMARSAGVCVWATKA